MQITATLHPQCPMARDWRVRTRPSGRVHGVTFHRRGVTFVTDPLSEDEVERLRPLEFVQIEVIAPAAESAPRAPRGPRKPAAPANLITDEELFGSSED